MSFKGQFREDKFLGGCPEIYVRWPSDDKAEKCCGSCHDYDESDNETTVPGEGYYSTCCLSGRHVRKMLNRQYAWEKN